MVTVLLLEPFQIFLQNINMLKQVLLLWMFFECGFAAQSLVICDDFYANSVLILSEDSRVSTVTRQCCTSGFKQHIVIGGPLQVCSNREQRNDTIQCVSPISNSLTGVSGILNCCPDVSHSFYLGSGIYPCSTHLSLPAATAHTLFEYCPSSSMMQSENLPTMNNRNNGELFLKFDLLLLLFASVAGIVI